MSLREYNIKDQTARTRGKLSAAVTILESCGADTSTVQQLLKEAIECQNNIDALTTEAFKRVQLGPLYGTTISVADGVIASVD